MNEKSNILEVELNKGKEMLDSLSKYYDERIVGQANLKKALLVSFMANGHILLESVPGLAKTTAARVLTDAVSGKFSKIQCTPDLLPSDIVGTQVFNYSINKFETVIGPVNANFVLLDEINRSSAKTQSAMLEVMQERKLSIAGVTYDIPSPFVVIATQNPIEQEGTYLLAEAQLDRFLLKEIITYPNVSEEMEILKRIESNIIENNKPILDINAVLYLQDLTKRVYVDDEIKRYIARIIYATRNADKIISPDLAKYVEMGSSPRGTIAIMNVSKALAILHNRNYVTPDDCKEMIHSILRHRITLNYAAVVDGVTVDDVIDAIVGAVDTP
jgi:MoxR-like ATPase